MGAIWGRQNPGGPHVGPMNLAIWGHYVLRHFWKKKRKMTVSKFDMVKIVFVMSILVFTNVQILHFALYLFNFVLSAYIDDVLHITLNTYIFRTDAVMTIF